MIAVTIWIFQAFDDSLNLFLWMVINIFFKAPWLCTLLDKLE